MREKNKNYLSILSIELLDLQTDIEALIENCTHEKEHGTMTEHVFMSNLTLFRNELLGVNVFGKIVDNTDPGGFPTLDEMIDYLKKRFDHEIRACGLSRAIYYYTERKMDKVARYVNQ
jgi:hypothetical protein